MRHRRFSDEGSSSLEFITGGLLLLVPMIYLVLAVSAIQGAALSIEGAARQAARVYVQAPNESEAMARAQRAVDFGLNDHGIEPGEATVALTCEPAPASCLQRLGLVTMRVSVSIALPLVPAILGLNTVARVPLSAGATQQVSRFWSGD